MTLRFERRESEREEARGSVVAAVTDGDGVTSLARVEMCDVSFGGIGLTSTVELKAGSGIALYGPEGHAATYVGTVVRCEAIDDGFRVGVRSAKRMAA